MAQAPLIENVKVEMRIFVIEGSFNIRVFELGSLILTFPYALSEEFLC